MAMKVSPQDDRDAGRRKNSAAGHGRASLISDPDAHIRKVEQHLNLPPLGAS